ncbi:MAG: hypothetical protein KGZ63_08780 [Clostridiales bacterium]|nr:hypothetical protein [Clostridiales bacterium]
MLTQIHHKLEILGYPQPDTQLRSWDENAFINMPSGTEQDQEEKPQSGGSTFFVRILYRQNTTWQGTVQSLDKKQTMPFCSLLELIMLINEAVTNANLTEKST